MLPWRESAIKNVSRGSVLIQQMDAATLRHRFASDSQLLLLWWQLRSPEIINIPFYMWTDVHDCTLQGNAFKSGFLWRVLQQELKKRENVWIHPLQESVGASCIHTGERECEQDGLTTQILSCAVLFHFVIRKWSAGLTPGAKASKRIWMAAYASFKSKQSV